MKTENQEKEPPKTSQINSKTRAFLTLILIGLFPSIEKIWAVDLFSDSFDQDLAKWTQLVPDITTSIEITKADGNPSPCVALDDFQDGGCAILSKKAFSYKGKQMIFSAEMKHGGAITGEQRYSRLALVKSTAGERFCGLTVVGGTGAMGEHSVIAGLIFDGPSGEETETSRPIAVKSGDGWHTARIRIRPDGIAEFFLDGDLKYTSRNRITRNYDGKALLALGDRKSFYGNVLVQEIWAPPSLTSISPTGGTVAGGTEFTLLGSNFRSSATVSFGGQAGEGVSVQSSTKITGRTPAHAEGAADITVTNSDGQSATLAGGFTYTSASDTNRPPVIGSGPDSSAAAPLVGDTVTFTLTASDPDGDTLTISWDFGDGLTGTESTATHAFSAAGKYSVTATVSDGKASVSASLTQIVYDGSTPTITEGPSASPNPAQINSAILFSAAASNAQGEAISYRWDFGDGGTGTGGSVSHSYAATGVYAVELTASASSGSSSAASLTVEVTDSGQGGKASGAMALTSVKLKLFFNKADSDSLTIKGSLEIPEGFVPKDTPVTVDIGGVLGGFTLDEKGKARQDTAGNTNRSLHIKCKFKKGALVAGETSFKVSFKKGEFDETWKTRGLLDDDVEGNTIELPVIMETTDRAYSNYASGTYSASEGKTGSFIAR